MVTNFVPCTARVSQIEPDDEIKVINGNEITSHTQVNTWLAWCLCPHIHARKRVVRTHARTHALVHALVRAP